MILHGREVCFPTISFIQLLCWLHLHQRANARQEWTTSQCLYAYHCRGDCVGSYAACAPSYPSNSHRYSIGADSLKHWKNIESMCSYRECCITHEKASKSVLISCVPRPAMTKKIGRAMKSRFRMQIVQALHTITTAKYSASNG
jgi:hypothetical protein